MKKFTILLIVAFCSLSMAFSQSYEELNQKLIEYYNKGDYSNAIDYAEKARIQAEKEFGKEHKNYVKSLNYLAILHGDMGNYDKAEPFYIEAINISKIIYGQDNPEYATLLDNLAILYGNIGAYAKAEPLFIEAMNIRKKTLGPDHPDYATSLNNLATLYNVMGEYAKAEPLFNEALNIRKKVFGADHPENITSLNNLAILYNELGNNAKAESMFIEVLDICKKAFGQDHPDYALYLNNLASFYFDMGLYSKAEPLYNESLNIRKKWLGPTHILYASSLDNLGKLYGEMGAYEKAELFFKEALNIGRNMLDSDHPYYITFLNDLAVLYTLMGNYTKAETIYVEALNTGKIIYGQDHPDYATSLNNLATLYNLMGEYAKAEPLFNEALNIREKSLGTDNPIYATSLNNLALFYCGIRDYEKVEPLLIQANDNLNNQIDKNFSFLSDIEKEQFLENNINYYFEIYNSFFLKRKDQNHSLAAISFNNELSHKAILLQNNIVLRQNIYSSGDSKLINSYNQFTDIHKKLSVLYTIQIAERKENIDSLENIANKIEKELIIKGQELPGFENFTGLTKIKWQDVQQSLKQNEAAIEFINFDYYDKTWTDSTYYCALVLRKDYQYPKMIYLFEEKQLQELLSKPQATNNAYYITQLYSYKPDLPSVDYQSSNYNILYQLIWQPIDSLLKGINTIYLAPSGLLNKVAFNAIPVTDSTLLSDKYQLNIVSSTRILAQKNKAAVSFSGNYNAALYGGIEYDMDSTEMVARARRYEKSDNNLLTIGNITIPADNRSVTWLYLPGTFTEVSNIEKLLKSKQITYTLFTGKNATEESFKHLAEKTKSPDILHLATHGFFFPEIKSKTVEMGKVAFRGGITNEQAFTYSENPLFRSGILLAGASNTWKTSHSIPGVEDGILTAYEVSNINLSNTKLVVLSACETGLGDIKGSEGVFGLQRAFKMAGVQYIVMSLWQVPDDQTSELMQLFYTNCLNRMTIKGGFRAAQQTMRKKYNPFYWAAFELVE